MVSSEGVSRGRGERRVRRPREGVSSANRGCECTGVDSWAIEDEAEAIYCSRVQSPARGNSATQLSVKPWPGSQAALQIQTKTQILHSEKTVQSAGKPETLISPVWTPQRSSSLAQRVQSAHRRGKPTSRTVQRAGCVCIIQSHPRHLLNSHCRSTISTGVACWPRSRSQCWPKQRLRLLRQEDHNRDSIYFQYVSLLVLHFLPILTASSIHLLILYNTPPCNRRHCLSFLLTYRCDSITFTAHLAISTHHPQALSDLRSTSGCDTMKPNVPRLRVVLPAMARTIEHITHHPALGLAQSGRPSTLNWRLQCHREIFGNQRAPPTNKLASE